MSNDPSQYSDNSISITTVSIIITPAAAAVTMCTMSTVTRHQTAKEERRRDDGEKTGMFTTFGSRGSMSWIVWGIVSTVTTANADIEMDF